MPRQQTHRMPARTTSSHETFPRRTAGTGPGRTQSLSRRRFLQASITAALPLLLRVRAVRAGGGLQVRRNAKSLTAVEKARFVRAVKAMKRLPSLYASDINAYDYYVRLHFAAYYDPEMPAHMASAFGPWHRLLVLMFEQDLQRTDPSVTVPYWDWTVDQGRNAYLWDDDLIGGEGDPDDRWIVKTGPFRAGEWDLNLIDPLSLDQDGTIFSLQRHFGVYVSGGEPTTRLPHPDAIAAALALPTYDVAPCDDFSDPTLSFRNNLEGFRKGADGSRLPSENHNRVHNWVGGAMSEGASPNDPVFWLHHSFVDLIYVEWQRRWSAAYLPESGARFHQNVRDPLWRMGGATPADLLDHRALGYIYDREGA